MEKGQRGRGPSAGATSHFKELVRHAQEEVYTYLLCLARLGSARIEQVEVDLGRSPFPRYLLAEAYPLWQATLEHRTSLGDVEEP